MKKKVFKKLKFFYEIIPHSPYEVQNEKISLIVTNQLWQISFFEPTWTA